MKENCICVRNASKSYGGRKVVDDLSFEVKKGEVFGLLGHLRNQETGCRRTVNFGYGCGEAQKRGVWKGGCTVSDICLSGSDPCGRGMRGVRVPVSGACGLQPAFGTVWSAGTDE